MQFLVERLQDRAEGPLAKNLQHLVMPQFTERSRLGGRGEKREIELVTDAGVSNRGGIRGTRHLTKSRPVEELTRFFMCRQQCFDLSQKIGIAVASLFQKSRSFSRIGDLQGRKKDRLFVHGLFPSGSSFNAGC